MSTVTRLKGAGLKTPGHLAGSHRHAVSDYLDDRLGATETASGTEPLSSCQTTPEVSPESDIKSDPAIAAGPGEPLADRGGDRVAQDRAVVQEAYGETSSGLAEPADTTADELEAFGEPTIDSDGQVTDVDASDPVPCSGETGASVTRICASGRDPARCALRCR